MHVHFACIFWSFSGPLTVWSVSISDCFYSLCLVVVLSKVVELAGVEPASEIPTYHFYYSKNSSLHLKTVRYCYVVFVHFTNF